MTIRIPRSIVDEIAAQAGAEAPNECCGYLAGRDGLVVERLALRNVDESPSHYRLDPQQQFAALHRAREAGLELSCVYHSHPETPAHMSEEDLRLAFDPDIAYVIYSLSHRQLRGYRVAHHRVAGQIAVEIVEHE